MAFIATRRIWKGCEGSGMRTRTSSRTGDAMTRLTVVQPEVPSSESWPARSWTSKRDERRHRPNSDAGTSTSISLHRASIGCTAGATGVMGASVSVAVCRYAAMLQCRPHPYAFRGSTATAYSVLPFSSLSAADVWSPSVRRCNGSDDSMEESSNSKSDPFGSQLSDSSGI